MNRSMTMALRPASLTLIIAASAALLFVSTSASAQWMWKDDAGHTIASDQPPPTGTPASRILKQPRQRSNASAPAVDAPKDAAKDAPKSLADRELESKQHAKEAAEASKKADDEATKTKAMAENCTAVKSNLAALQAGGRAARYNDKGEKVYIDDSQRQDEINKQQGQVTQYCK